jgi:2-amino-4-hydroxy-6-hydroxymethyldihydropteridine diphosphokinase
MSPLHTVYLHTGSNIGNRAGHLQHAVQRIEAEAGALIALSALYVTEPWGNTRQPEFLNQALCIHTALQPHELLRVLLAIETNMGRRRIEKWGERIIDLDIIFFDDRVIDTAGLHIPHRQAHLRNFVLAPLCEIAPDFVHPVLNKTIRQLLEESPDTLQATPLPREPFQNTGA